MQPQQQSAGRKPRSQRTAEPSCDIAGRYVDSLVAALFSGWNISWNSLNKNSILDPQPTKQRSMAEPALPQLRALPSRSEDLCKPQWTFKIKNCQAGDMKTSKKCRIERWERRTKKFICIDISNKINILCVLIMTTWENKSLPSIHQKNAIKLIWLDVVEKMIWLSDYQNSLKILSAPIQDNRNMHSQSAGACGECAARPVSCTCSTGELKL